MLGEDPEGEEGSHGFLHLGMRPEQIARALHLASRGEVVVPRELVANLVKGEEPSNLLALTARQKREVLELVAEGKSNAEIARQLFLAKGTVKQHLRAAYKLLGVGRAGHKRRVSSGGATNKRS